MSTTDALQVLQSRCKKRLVLVDAGARWGVHDRWPRLGSGADILCFEPDISECARLNATKPENVRYFPYGLADSSGPRKLYVTSEPACSSLHRPIQALCESYPPLAMTKLEKTVDVHCRRLDDVIAEENPGEVAAIKLDTQGSELTILRGATTTLKACSIVDVEVEFNPIYSGQGLFCDVDRFLRDHGFVLWRLENLVHYAPEIVREASAELHVAAEPGAAVSVLVPNGQVFWAQAQYVRSSYPRTGTDSLSLDEACAAAVLAGLYGFWDLALELIRKAGDRTLLQTMRDTLTA